MQNYQTRKELSNINCLNKLFEKDHRSKNEEQEHSGALHWPITGSRETGMEARPPRMRKSRAFVNVVIHTYNADTCLRSIGSVFSLG